MNRDIQAVEPSFWAGWMAAAGMVALGLPTRVAELSGRGRWRDEKALLAVLIRRRTGVANGWIAERLAMGHAVNVTRAVRRLREDRTLAKRMSALEQLFES